MKKNVIYYLTLFLMLFTFWGCSSTTSEVKQSSLEPQEETLINSIDIQDNSVTISANNPFIYTMYRPGDPYKMIVDLPDVSIGAFKERIVSNKAGITEIIPSQINSPSFMARLELLLQAPSVVEQDYRNNTLTIKIKEEEPKEASPAVFQVGENVSETEKDVSEEKEESAEPEKVQQESLPKATEVTNISFEPTAKTVNLIVKANGSMIPNIFPLDDRIVIDIPNVSLNTQIPQTVLSPVKGIRSGQYGDKTRLVLDLSGKTEFDVTAIGDSIVVALQRTDKETPVSTMAEESEEGETTAETSTPKEETKEPEALVEGRYTGKKISLDFQDADIVPIFRLLADISGYNIVVSPQVKGKLTMKLINVPWDQALDLILKTFSLGKSVEGNIIRIAPHTVFAKESEDSLKAKEAGMKVEPVKTKIFPISYADVKVVASSIKESKILSPRGSLSVDERTSSLLINDIESVFPEVEKLLETLDKATPQVLIEARIVEVNTSDVTDLGIQWGTFIKGTNTLTSLGGFSGLGTGPFTGQNFLVDFPGGSSAGSGAGFSFGILDPAKTMGLDLQLSAVETLGKGKIISNPRIMTKDNEEAKILQGKSIPVRKLTTEGTVSTEYKDVNLELDVKPHITPDSSIDMIIQIRKEELDFTLPSIEGVPATDKKEAKTNVLIKDGETIVIGGIYKITKAENETGVPGLMNIPLLGWLFKKYSDNTTTSELLMFITPRIVQKP